MEKTQEQNDSRRQELIENFIEQLKGEYKDFSAVISVNDGKETSCLVYGNATNLMNNIDCIEANGVYQKVKKLNDALNLIKED